ncbi:helix-turn-helix domain-containing protein [Streptomyces sp. NPDC055140]
MQLRYAFRLYPEPGQRLALGRAFGCARVVFNDAVRARKDAHVAGLPYPKAAELSQTLITRAKRTVERSWLGEVRPLLRRGNHHDDRGDGGECRE